MRQLRLALVALLAIWLQAGFFAAWRPLGVVPNILLIAVVYAGLTATAMEATVIGMIGGLVLDFYSGTDFGLRTAFYSMLALAVAVIHRAGAESGSWGMVAVLVSGATAMFNLAVVATLASSDTLRHLPGILAAVGIELTANVLLAVALGPVLRRALTARPGLANVEVASS